MKKLFKLILVFFAGSLFLVSCQKDRIEPEVLSSTSEFKINEVPLHQVPLHEEDKEDEVINFALMDLSRALLPFGIDQAFVDFVVEKAQSNNGLVLLEHVFEHFPTIKDVMTSDFLGTAACPFVHTGYQYKTALFVPNFEIARKGQLPVLSPGIELYDDIKNDNPDIIFAWDVLADGQSIAINIGEKEAMQTNRPIINLTLELCERQADGLSKANLGNAKLPMISADEFTWRGNRFFSSYEIKLNHRYDRSNRSEFWCQSNRIISDGTFEWINSSSGGRYEVATIHRDDIGAQVKVWKYFAGNYTPYSDNTVLYNTYERDWYASYKDLGSGTAFSTTLNYEGRRRYYDEWYSFDPDDPLGAHVVDLQAIVDNWTQRYYFDNGKGYWNVWRIEQ